MLSNEEFFSKKAHPTLFYFCTELGEDFKSLLTKNLLPNSQMLDYFRSSESDERNRKRKRNTALVASVDVISKKVDCILLHDEVISATSQLLRNKITFEFSDLRIVLNVFHSCECA